MVQIKMIRSSPDSIEKDVNQWIKEMYRDPSKITKIIDIKYTTPSTSLFTAMITYTRTHPRQRKMSGDSRERRFGYD